MKRLCVFCFYNRNGILSQYTEYLIGEIITVVDRFVVVVTGSINKESKHDLKKYTNEIIIRENFGYDACAYKRVLCDYFSSKEVSLYDELILCNDTFLGPFVRLKTIFERMNRIKCDFWGLNLSVGGMQDFLHQSLR